MQNPYREEDFEIESFPLVAGVTALKITFPEPEIEPLCYKAYLFFDQEFEIMSYFCRERAYEEGEEEKTALLCSWYPNHNHAIIGESTFDDRQDIFNCIEVYMKKYSAKYNGK